MKRVMTLALGALFVGSMAMAADNEAKESQTTDTFKNPITGTQTVTNKYAKKMKTRNGENHQVDVVEKTKIKKNGKVEKEVEVEAEAEGQL